MKTKEITKMLNEEKRKSYRQGFNDGFFKGQHVGMANFYKHLMKELKQ